jgi:hypothetical protein
VFDREFQDDLAVIAFAIREFALPANLKLSVHSGSDKFSLYPLIRQALGRTGAGLHLKTAGTTWLEEVAGLALGGGDGLVLAKEIYGESLKRFDELAAPYASVIDIDPHKLPAAAEVVSWTTREFVDALGHDQTNPGFNPSLRQLIHVGYKVAAEKGARFRQALEDHRAEIANRVTSNLWERHLRPLFVAEP